ncbi:MAG: hypothetical protein AB8G11_16875 [Saprospiraceae bacterium]
MTYWIKPIGSTDAKINKNQVWSSKFQEQHFHRRPVGIQTGDILITYAVVHQLLEGVYKVIGNTFREASKEQKIKDSWRERYPYIWDTENISQEYSANWSTYNLNLFDLEKEFLRQGNKITPNASNSLNQIQFGVDKLKISEEFNQFLIETMNMKL